MVPPTVDSHSRGSARELDVVLGTAALMLMLPSGLVFVVATTALLAPLIPGGESELVGPPSAALLAVTSLLGVTVCWCRVARSLATAVEAALSRPVTEPVTEPVTVPAPRSGEVGCGARGAVPEAKLTGSPAPTVAAGPWPQRFGDEGPG